MQNFDFQFINSVFTDLGRTVVGDLEGKELPFNGPEYIAKSADVKSK